jgi:mono/diheme cytochrome c family protein
MCCCSQGCCCSNGKWTFGYLMSQIANTSLTGVSTNTLIVEWLDHWMKNVTVNGDLATARTGIFARVIAPWARRSNLGANVTTLNWKTFNYNLCHAPFRLLAIVPRFDLRNNPGYGGSISNSGEGRFVFGIMDSTLCFPLQNVSKGTVIFEYGIPISSCEKLVEYAKGWYSLRSMIPGSAAYNTKLESLTDVFTKANAAPAKPNGSALNQIRTNELAFGAFPWELREFVISPTTKLLVQNTVNNEPHKKFNRLAGATAADAATLTSWLTGIGAPIGTPVPLTFLGNPFQGGKAHTEGAPANPMTHSWDGTANPAPTAAIVARRFDFSLNTCSGCHGGDANTGVGNLLNNPAGVAHNPPAFVHINPTPCNTMPTLSAFLTGDPAQADKQFRVVDRVYPNFPTGVPNSNVHLFNDLLNRARDLRNLIRLGCGGIIVKGSLTRDLADVLTFRPLRAAH